MDNDKYLLSSVDHTLSLVELLAHHDEMTLAEIIRDSGYDKSSTFRMLYTLVQNQIVEKTDDGHYKLGIKLLYYASKVLQRQDTLTVAKPFMKILSQQLNMPILFGQLSGNRILTIHIEDEVAGPHVTGRMGMNASAHTTAMGRICLASMDDEARSAVLDTLHFKRYSDHSVLSRQELEPVLHEAQVNGYAMDIDDRYPGFGSIAVPLRDFNGTCVAALGIVSTTAEISNRKEGLISAMKDTASKVNEALGYRM